MARCHYASHMVSSRVVRFVDVVTHPTGGIILGAKALLTAVMITAASFPTSGMAATELILFTEGSAPSHLPQVSGPLTSVTQSPFQASGIFFLDFLNPSPLNPTNTTFGVFLTDPVTMAAADLLILHSGEVEDDGLKPFQNNLFSFYQRGDPACSDLTACATGLTTVSTPDLGGFQDLTSLFATVFDLAAVLPPTFPLQIAVQTPASAVPEPASFSVLGLGLLALACVRVRSP
jgi:hypothetical protein